VIVPDVLVPSLRLGVSTATASFLDCRISSSSSTAVGSTAADVIHWRELSVRIPKPLGLVIEEVDANDPSKGVEIVQITIDGNTAAANRQQLTTMITTDDVVCLGDRILSVNGVGCSNYDEVIDQIVSSPEEHHHPVDLVLGRPSESVVVHFQGKSSTSGVCVTALPGDYLGNIANRAEIDYNIPYSCRSGRCGICEQSLLLLSKKKEKKTGKTIRRQQCQKVRPCVYRIPNDNNIISMQVSALTASKNRLSP